MPLPITACMASHTEVRASVLRSKTKCLLLLRKDLYLSDGGMGGHYAQQEYSYRSFDPTINQIPQLIDVNDDLCRFGFSSPVSRAPPDQISPPVSPRDPRPSDCIEWDANAPRKRKQQSPPLSVKTKKHQVISRFMHRSSQSLTE